jgi:hypothetical protein
MLAAVDWEQWASFLAVLSAIGGVFMFFVRRWLKGEFVGHHAMLSIEGRVGKLEQVQAGLLDEEDLRALNERMGGVETSVAVVQSSVNATQDSIKRVERGVDMLLQHALKVDP